MTREALQTALKQQQENLNWIRKISHIDQSHPMFAKADEIQQLINEINDDCYPFPNSTIVNDVLFRHIESQIDWLKKAVFVRN